MSGMFFLGHSVDLFYVDVSSDAACIRRGCFFIEIQVKSKAAFLRHDTQSFNLS